MDDLVLMYHDEPMTTSLAMAEGVQMEHKSVIQLVRKYAEDLQEFGTSTFEMRKSGGMPTEFAWLNEQQATFLLTLMRNSPIVIAFKKALVKAFFELRDKVRSLPMRDEPLTLSHRADVVVAADRIFRGFMRSARQAGVGLPRALRIANDQTRLRTGMDMLAEMEIDPEEMAVQKPARITQIEEDPIRIGLRQWAETSERGKEYRLREILTEVVGAPLSDKSFQRMSPGAGRLLRSIGFSGFKAHRFGGTFAIWVRR